MINGVLVERTIKDVKPALQTNSDGLKKVLDDLVKQYKGLQDEMEKWKVRQSNPRYSMEITADMFIAEKEQCPSSPAMILRIPEFSLRMHGIDRSYASGGVCCGTTWIGKHYWNDSPGRNMRPCEVRVKTICANGRMAASDSFWLCHSDSISLL